MTKVLGLAAEKGRWIYVFLGLLINLCLGSVYSWSIFKKPVEELFNTTATASGFPYMFSLAAFALLMPLVGKLLDRYGPRIMTITGGLLVGLGWILAGFSTNIVFLTIAYALLAGGGVGVAYGAPLLVSTKWFPDRKGLAVGLTLVGFGLSALITAPLAQWLIDLTTPLHTFKILGAGFAVLIILAALPLKLPPEEWKPKDYKPSAAASMVKELAPGQMLKTPAFWGLWICYTFGTLAGLMAIGISKPVGQEIVMLPPAVAAVTVSLFAVFNGIGRPIFGWFTNKAAPRIAAVTSFILILLASLGMLIAGEGTTVLYIVAFSLFWLCLGGWLAIAPTATAVFFGTKNYARNYGIMFTAYGAGAILGSLLSGRLRDLLGSYKFVFYPTAALAVVGIVIALFLIKPPKVREKNSQKRF